MYRLEIRFRFGLFAGLEEAKTFLEVVFSFIATAYALVVDSFVPSKCIFVVALLIIDVSHLQIGFGAQRRVGVIDDKVIHQCIGSVLIEDSGNSGYVVFTLGLDSSIGIGGLFFSEQVLGRLIELAIVEFHCLLVLALWMGNHFSFLCP